MLFPVSLMAGPGGELSSYLGVISMLIYTKSNRTAFFN